MVNKALTLNYNYSQLKEELQHPLVILTQQAKTFERQALENIVGFGEVLVQVQELIPHGEFGNWLQQEFSLSHQTAYNFMNIAKRFGEEIEVIKTLPISLTALYRLADPNTPEAVVTHSLEKAKSGKKVKVSEIQELKKELKNSKVENEQFEDEIKELLDERETSQETIEQLELKISQLESTSFLVQETEDNVAIIKDPEAVDEIASLEIRLKELKLIERELEKRIKSKEKFEPKGEELIRLEKLQRLRSFKNRIVQLLATSMEEQLILSTDIMTPEIREEYVAVISKLNELETLCQNIIATVGVAKEVNAYIANSI
jgi:hypothetical protein